MTAYIDFIIQNRDRVHLEIIHAIDDKSLISTLFRRSNVMCDGLNYYIGDELIPVPIKNRKALRGFLSKINGKMILSATDNSLGCTRLIYKVTFKRNILK